MILKKQKKKNKKRKNEYSQDRDNSWGSRGNRTRDRLKGLIA